jgi:CRISPR-associated protein Cas5d
MRDETHTLEVWGDLACFTRPELKVERFSYPVITPSAARGIFDAIYWHGQRNTIAARAAIQSHFYWQVTRIELLEFPRYIALRRNEVKDKAPALRTIASWMSGQSAPEPIWADATKDDLGTDQKGRTQRQTMALKNVRYRITARIEARAALRPELPALNAQFVRRARSGKCFQQPYFGCREFPAYFEYLPGEVPRDRKPVPFDQHLGFMLYDVFDLEAEETGDVANPCISVFDAHVRVGVLEVPPYGDPRVRKPARRP